MFKNYGELDADFWERLWTSGLTGWDMREVSPPIKAYIDKLSNKEIRILIPGCGYAHEADYLLGKDFTDISLVEISHKAASVLTEKYKDFPQVKVIHSDFFDLDDKFDLIFEQTLFCTVFPDKRPDYVQKMASLLNPKGKLAGVLFNTSLGPDGPPFGGTAEEYRKVFEPYFNILKLEDCQNSFPQRMGMEYFIEFSRK